MGTFSATSPFTRPEADVETAPIPRIDIRAEVAERITFASHQCDVAVLADLVISNPLNADLEI
jgi:hypothetical protein